ncbi:putative lipoprotein [Paenibacillus castaneae]|uniref:hypothetical protein n=1 Tax=Paenibacillus castaneae TaxID=474957 RepID=UPI000C9AC17D|nr:hypothetical protein [Paenibacillus castaneae]NIK80239.1 putative lipoprotein [Paenibacillus castaneae]
MKEEDKIHLLFQMEDEDAQIDLLLTEWSEIHQISNSEANSIRSAIIEQETGLSELWWSTLYSRINRSISFSNQRAEQSLNRLSSMQAHYINISCRG